jgi:glycosyltransferase involved in cell wall biosynthesis
MRSPVAIITTGCLWPVSDGGKVRTAAIAEQLASQAGVVVLQPTTEVSAAPPPTGIELEYYAASRSPGSWGHFVSREPRLGRAFLDPDARASLRGVLEALGPRVVVSAHSYIAAVIESCLDDEAIHIVDFPNVESRRWRSIARGAAGKSNWAARLEAAKASRWEGRVASSASLVLATTEHDQVYLSRKGGNTCLVRNTAEPVARPALSPPRGPVTYLASGRYAPNVAAGRWLITEVWPQVVSTVPWARLRIVGHDTDKVYGWAAHQAGVDVVGPVDVVGEALRDAAMVLAPASQGGGSQLKVVEALAHRRLVVGTALGACGVPSEIGFAYRTVSGAGEMAWEIASWLRDPGQRHALEARLGKHEQYLGWRTQCAPLVDYVANALRRARR